MSGILKKLFGNKNLSQPSELIFPGESFSILKLDFPDGWGLASVNKAYDNYPHKPLYPWHVLIEIEVIDKNENGHPTVKQKSLTRLKTILRNY